jgi:hypothetical protein
MRRSTKKFISPSFTLTAEAHGFIICRGPATREGRNQIFISGLLSCGDGAAKGGCSPSFRLFR